MKSKTYRILREYDPAYHSYFWFAYKLTLAHKLFGKPYGYIPGSCSNESAADCENKLREILRDHPDKVEWDIQL